MQKILDARDAALAALDAYRHALAYEVETLDATIRQLKGEPETTFGGEVVASLTEFVGLPKKQKRVGAVAARDAMKKATGNDGSPMRAAMPEPVVPTFTARTWSGKGRKPNWLKEQEKAEVKETRPRSRGDSQPINPMRLKAVDETPTLASVV